MRPRPGIQDDSTHYIALVQHDRSGYATVYACDCMYSCCVLRWLMFATRRRIAHPLAGTLAADKLRINLFDAL
jgi:hypothetical protein